MSRKHAPDGVFSITYSLPLRRQNQAATASQSFGDFYDHFADIVIDAVNCIKYYFRK